MALVRDAEGRPLSVVTPEEQAEMLAASLSTLSLKERRLLEVCLRQLERGDDIILNEIAEHYWRHQPVSMRQFIEDPYYLGASCETLFPKLADDLCEIFRPGAQFREVIFTGAIGIGKCLRGSTDLFDARSGCRVRLDEVPCDVPGAISAPAYVGGAGSRAMPATVTMAGCKIVGTLRLQSGRWLDMTPDHPVLTPTGYSPVGELKVGDFVATLRQLPGPERPLVVSDEEVEFVAFMLANGSCTSGNWAFTNAPGVVLERFHAVAASMRAEVGSEYDVDGARRDDGTAGCETWYAGGTRWVQRKYGMTSLSRDKRVPGVLFGLNDRQLGLFLNRIWSTDGHVNVGSGFFEITLASARFIEDIGQLLLRFGVHGRIYTEEKSYVHNGERRTRPAWRLCVSSRDNIQRMAACMGPVLGHEFDCRALVDKVSDRSANTNVDVVPVNNAVLRRIWDEVKPGSRIRPWKRLRYLGRASFLELSQQCEFPSWCSWWGDVLWDRVESFVVPDDAQPEIVYDVEVPGPHNFAPGGIVVHNTTILSIVACRVLYEMSCLINPQLAYGLSPGSEIGFAMISKNLYLAEDVLKSAVDDKLKISPYFQAHFTPKRKGGDKTLFPSNLYLFIGSYGSERVMGANVFFAAMDEANFARSGRQVITTPDGSKRTLAHFDHSEVVYRSLVRRIKSRFQKNGTLPGMVVVVSSAATVGSFIERRVTESQNDPSVFIRDYPLWGVKPPGTYGQKRFRVLCGGAAIRSRILTDDEVIPPDVLESGEARIIDVPDEFRVDFESSLEDSIRDLAGVSTTAISAFIQRPEKIELCINGQKHPCSVQSWRFGDPIEWYWERIAQKFQRRLPGGFEEDAWKPLRNPDRMRYIHIDTSLSGDCTGFAMGHVERFVEVVRRTPEGEQYTEMAPYYVIDFMLQIRPPVGEQIFMPEVRSFVYMLMEHGFILCGFSCDQYQCLAGDMRVPTDQGIVPLRDVQIGDMVTSRSGLRPVRNKWSFGNRQTFRVVTDDGEFIEGTDRHRIEVFCGYSGMGRRGKELKNKMHRTWGGVRLQTTYEWRRLDEIRPGDVVRMWTEETVDASYIQLCPLDRGALDWHGGLGEWVAPCELREELAELLGAVWANGTVDDDGIRITSDGRDAVDVDSVVCRCLGRSTPFRFSESGSKAVQSISGRWFVRWLRLNGLDKRDGSEGIPAAIWRSPRSVRGAFLRGLFSGDGSVDVATGACTFSTKWQSLARDVQQILRCTWGFDTWVTEIQRGHPGDYVQDGFQYVVGVRGSRERFLQNVGFCYDRKQSALKKNRGRPGRALLTRVNRIESSMAEVFDIEVEGDPSYVANGFVSHNSAETLQQVKRRGVATEILSVDTSMDPYEKLRSAIYERRIEFYRHETLLFELRALEHDRGSGKVDHPMAGAKDVADAVAGVVAGLAKKAARLPLGVVREEAGHDASDMSWVTGQKKRDGDRAGYLPMPFIGDE
jgi:intein/homing endonuclease